jgi:heme/copper-type cytochrome/quinol oxidase subunit 2
MKEIDVTDPNVALAEQWLQACSEGPASKRRILANVGRAWFLVLMVSLPLMIVVAALSPFSALFWVAITLPTLAFIFLICLVMVWYQVWKLRSSGWTPPTGEIRYRNEMETLTLRQRLLRMAPLLILWFLAIILQVLRMK